LTVRFGRSLGAPFQTELQSVREAIDGLRRLIEADRVALLHDGFGFLAQGDVGEARVTLTRAKTRKPRTVAVRFWLGAVLAAQSNDPAAEFSKALRLNPYAVPVQLTPTATSASEAPLIGPA
jgi:hypothetical protein